MRIDNLTQTVENIENDPLYLATLESHLSYLKKMDTAVTNSITPRQSYKYEGDFYGLLSDMRIDKSYHYIILRMNNYTSPTDYKGEVKDIVIPDLAEVDLIKNIYMTRNA